MAPSSPSLDFPGCLPPALKPGPDEVREYLALVLATSEAYADVDRLYREVELQLWAGRAWDAKRDGVKVLNPIPRTRASGGSRPAWVETKAKVSLQVSPGT